MTVLAPVVLASLAIVLGCSGDDGGGDDGGAGTGGQSAAAGSAGVATAGGGATSTGTGGAGSGGTAPGSGGAGGTPMTTNETVAGALSRGCASAKVQCPNINEADCGKQYVFEGQDCFAEYAALALCIGDLMPTDFECVAATGSAAPKSTACPEEASAYKDCSL